jgi:hypothetical protein
VPAPVAEEPCVADHERRDLVGLLARPGEPNEPAPVVDDHGDPAESELAVELVERGEVAFERGGAVVGRVAEAVEVGSDRSPPRSCERLHRWHPHERALGKTVGEEHRRTGFLALGQRLAVGEALGHSQLDRTHCGRAYLYGLESSDKIA